MSSKLSIYSGLCLSVLLTQLPLVSIAHAAVEEYSAPGQLMVKSEANQSVIIDLHDDTNPRVVTGNIAIDAILERNNTASDLRDFQIGDHVQVVWKKLNGHNEIIALLADDQLSPAPSSPTQDPANQVAAPAAPTLPPPLIRATVAKKLATTGAVQLIGEKQHHIVDKKETLLDIARNYDLGYNEIVDLYPDYDPWLPPHGTRLELPTQRLLPDSKQTGIVVNVAEMRLYYFFKRQQNTFITSYPIGIGDVDFPTPTGSYSIANKVINPTWYIPVSLREKYGTSSIPPGPDNPLGRYWLGLSNSQYGIHGTDIPWSIGRTVTHGCIRMYPEDIEPFFTTIEPGVEVHLIYEPVKIGLIDGRVMIEVHKDIYNQIQNLELYTKEKLALQEMLHLVDEKKFALAIQQATGLPTDITSEAGSLD